MVKDGYKLTDIGIIPEDWTYDILDNSLELLTDFEANGSFETVKENVNIYDSANFAWYVRATDLEKKSLLSEVKYIDKSSYEFLKKTALYGNELLITKRGEIGKVYLFEKKYKYATLAPNLYLLKLKNTVEASYLYSFFKSKVGNRLLLQKNASSTLGALYKDDVKSIKIPLPSQKEQKAIAKALSDTDELIDSLQSLIEKKENIKIGTMQQLLTGKKRLKGFTEEWEEKELSKFITFYKGKGLAKSQIIDNAKYKCVHYGELFTKYKEVITNIDSYTNIKNNMFVSKVNDVLMPTSDVTPNGLATASCINESGIVLGGDILVIRPNNELNGGFLAYTISINKNQILQLVTGSTVYHLYGSDMARYRFKMPHSIKEQEKIVATLSNMDKEIESLKAKLEKTKAIKEAMMDELLTGKTRLL